MRQNPLFLSGRPYRLAAFILFILVFFSPLAPAWPAECGEWEVYFSPGGGAAAALIRSFDQAQTSVYVQAYKFTSSRIAKALKRAHLRGVKVSVILDKSNLTDKYSKACFLVDAGIPTYIDAAHGIMHDKVSIIDENTVLTGSFNYTEAAERDNAENLFIDRRRGVAARYLENWRSHAKHSTKYLGKAPISGHGGTYPGPIPYSMK